MGKKKRRKKSWWWKGCIITRGKQWTSRTTGTPCLYTKDDAETSNGEIHGRIRNVVVTIREVKSKRVQQDE